MVFFAIETDKNAAIKEFMAETDKRLQNSNIVQNPFMGFTYLLETVRDKYTYVIKMAPVYPPVYWGGILGVIVTLVLAGGLTWWLTPSVLIMSAGIFWSKPFFYSMLKYALQRKGYKGPMRIIDNDTIITKLVHKLL